MRRQRYEFIGRYFEKDRKIDALNSLIVFILEQLETLPAYACY